MNMNLETDQETWSVRFPHDEKLKYPKRNFSPELEEKNMYSNLTLRLDVVATR